MDNVRVRELCLSLPHVTEAVGWGHHLVFWVGDKAIGGKMFALIHLDDQGTGVLWFHSSVEHFHELLETEGIIPSPYMARAHWVTLERWGVLRPKQIEQELRAAHSLVYEKLPKRTKAVLEMPEKDRYKVIRERKKVLVARAKKASASKAMEPSA
jgi:predicted DNA-binding protein (MmcQ/YjbR family)